MFGGHSHPSLLDGPQSAGGIAKHRATRIMITIAQTCPHPWIYIMHIADKYLPQMPALQMEFYQYLICVVVVPRHLIYVQLVEVAC